MTAKLKKQLVLSKDSGKNNQVKLKRILSPPQKTTSPMSDLTSILDKIPQNSINETNSNKKSKKVLQISITDASSFTLNSPKYLESMTAKGNPTEGIFITSPHQTLNKSDIISDG